MSPFFHMFSAFQAIRAKEALSADSSLSELKAGLQASERPRSIGCFAFRMEPGIRWGMAAGKVPAHSSFKQNGFEVLLYFQTKANLIRPSSISSFVQFDVKIDTK